jgi:lipoyl-dependent peroxiredoxin subunit C
MLTIGDKFPQFKKKCVVSLEPGKEFKDISSSDLKGKWFVMFWYPKDFTFVCPTEISGFNKSFDEFKSRGADLIGASTDSEFVHLAWRNDHKDLKGLKFPLLADTSKSLAEALGILTQDDEKIAHRAAFIVDPEGVIKFVCVTDLSVGRNIHEIIRVLDATQSGKLTPCDWEPGQATL